MGAQEKWDRIYSSAGIVLPKACSVLTEYRYLLPQHGQALDIACGLGGNALLLAQHGLQTTAVDISGVAIEKLTGCAEKQGLAIHAIALPVTQEVPGVERYDVITVSNYLDRDLFPALITGLKPNGLLFYQTFVTDKTADIGPSSPQYLLAANELLSLLHPLSVLAFSDLGSVGDPAAGLRNQSYVVARRTV